LSEFNAFLNFLNKFSKNTQISNLMKIRPVGAELFYADGRTYGQTDRWTEGRTKTDMEKTIAFFRYFANTLKKWTILIRENSKKNETI
jgi:hypothetical protein